MARILSVPDVHGSHDWEVVTILPKNSYDYTYIDRKSEPGKIYYYKVKSYCYLYGKKYVSSVAERIKLTVAEPAQEL